MVLKDLPPVGHPSRHLSWETHTHTAELWLSRKWEFQGQSPIPATTGFPLELKMTKLSDPSRACFGRCAGHEAVCGGNKSEAGSTVISPSSPHSMQFLQNAAAKEVK